MGVPGGMRVALADKLASLLGIEVLHLEQKKLHGMEEKARQKEWRMRVDKFVQQETWIMEGNNEEVMDIGLADADTAIVFNLPYQEVPLSAFQRTLSYWMASGSTQTAGGYTKWDFQFLKYVWTYPKKLLPLALKRVKKYKIPYVHVLHSSEEVQSFLENLQEELVYQ